MRTAWIALTMTLLLTGGCNWFRARGVEPAPEQSRLRDVINAGEPGPAAPVTEDVTPERGPVDEGGVIPGNYPPDQESAPAPPSDPKKSSTKTPEESPVGREGGIDVPNLSEATRPGNDADNDADNGNDAGNGSALKSDQVVPIGGVMARVNGKAIYTDEVLRDVRPILRARARTMTRDRYQQQAQAEIKQQLDRLIADQIRLTQAQRSLTDQEKGVARNRAFEWRRQQVTEAGGSFTEANSRAKKLGFDDLDQMVDRKFDSFLIDVYMQRKLLPRVQVTAEEMRQRYQQIVDSTFTTKSQAKFRLLRVNESAAGGEDAAKAKLERIKQQIDAGEMDFVTAAAQTNDDASLLANSGDLGLGMMERGSYRHRAIEDAVYNADVGETVGPLPLNDSQGKAWVLAYVEQKTDGRVQRFEEPATQEELRRQLRQEKFVELQQEESRTEQAKALVDVVSDGMQTALDIALLDYDRWNAGT